MCVKKLITGINCSGVIGIRTTLQPLTLQCKFCVGVWSLQPVHASDLLITRFRTLAVRHHLSTAAAAAAASVFVSADICIKSHWVAWSRWCVAQGSGFCPDAISGKVPTVSPWNRSACVLSAAFPQAGHPKLLKFYGTLNLNCPSLFLPNNAGTRERWVSTHRADQDGIFSAMMLELTLVWTMFFLFSSLCPSQNLPIGPFFENEVLQMQFAGLKAKRVEWPLIHVTGVSYKRHGTQREGSYMMSQTEEN